MKGKWLAVLAVVVLGAAIALWLALDTTDRPGWPTATPSTGSAPVATADPSTATPPAPALPGDAAPAPSAAPDDAGVRSYTVGGIQVRDHRSGSQTPLDIPPNVHAPSARRLPSQLTHAISQQLKQVMVDCANDLSHPAGEHPRLEGQIVVGIKDGQMSIAKSTMQLRGASGAEVDATKSCIEQRSLGLTTPAADQADLDAYSISVSFAIP